jgi:hypothetical protein
MKKAAKYYAGKLIRKYDTYGDNKVARQEFKAGLKKDTSMSPAKKT